MASTAAATSTFVQLGGDNAYAAAAHPADAMMMMMMMMMMVLHHLQSFAAQIRSVASTEDIILSCRSAELTELKSILDSDLGQGQSGRLGCTMVRNHCSW